jgi:hypothetical protein
MLRLEASSKRKKEENTQETSSSLYQGHRTAELQAHQIHNNNNASL